LKLAAFLNIAGLANQHTIKPSLQMREHLHSQDGVTMITLSLLPLAKLMDRRIPVTKAG
jgi:hypothetical protein